MDDLISRQAAIDAIEKAMCEDGFRSSTGLIHKTTAYEIIRHLPSAQPERKKGKWIREPAGAWMWTCSYCGKDDAYAYSADDAHEPTVLQDFYCPNCGSKMEE